MLNFHKVILIPKFLVLLFFSLLLAACGQIEATQSTTAHPEASHAQTKTTPQQDFNAGKPFNIGKQASATVIAGWDIDVRPDGLGLPSGSGSVEDGEELFEEKCSACHGSFGEGVNRWPKLAGGEGSLQDIRPERTVGSYWPYASTLWDYINRAMPFPAPQSLETDEVYAITAYVLNLNEIVDEDFVLTQGNFSTIEMPNKNGFYLDDRPDSSNTRCMENCKDPASIQLVLPLNDLSNSSTEEQTATQSEGNSTLLAKNAYNKNTSNESAYGKSAYDKTCKTCHQNGVGGAPRVGNAEDWASRLAQGKENLYNSALYGLNAMPAKGGNTDLSGEKVKAAVDYMLSVSQSK